MLSGAGETGWVDIVYFVVLVTVAVVSVVGVEVSAL